MAKQRGLSNNVKAGAFVLVAIAGAFTIVVVIAGLRERWKPRDSYIVYFDLLTGATGLEVGSIVNVAGMEVGRVSDITLVPEPKDGREPGVYVDIKVDRSIHFYGSPRGYLERPLLGAGAVINFTDIGDPETESLLAQGGVLRGAIAPPSFLAQAGYGEEQANQLQNILRRGDEISEDVKAMTGDFRGKSKGWIEDADRIVANVRTASDDLPDITASAKSRLDELRDIFSRARAVIDDNRSKIDTIVANAESASDHLDELLGDLNTETKDLLNGMLQDGRDAVADARTQVNKVGDLITEQTPNIRRAFANARLASDQLKLTLAEVRRAPWRLLYRPDTRELEFEYLYDSARTFAEAVSDLRAAGEALQGVASLPVGSERQVQELLQNLEQAFQTYADAERGFLKLVTESAAPAGK